MRRLGSQPWAWSVLAWTFAVGAARAIRWPNDFAEAHWLLDYQFGFVRRALPGALSGLAAGALGLSMTPRLVAACSALAFAGFVFALAAALRRLLRGREADDPAWLACLVFACSPFVVMQAHVFGYFDAIVYALTIVAVFLTLSDRPVSAALVLVAALLVHENVMVVGYPLVCLASLARLEARAPATRGAWGRYAAALCLPPLGFVAASALQSLTSDAETLRFELAAWLDSFGFVETRSHKVALWLTTGFAATWEDQAGRFGEHLTDGPTARAGGPALLAGSWFLQAAFRVPPANLLGLVLWGAVAAPLALHAVAWDMERISTYTLGSAFLAAWILSETRAPQPVGRAFGPVALAALLLAVFGRMRLMDGEVERFSGVMRALLYLPTVAFACGIAVRLWRSGGRTGAARLSGAGRTAG